MARKRSERRPAERGEFRPAPYNPRRITPEALAALRASLRTFGDLSGFVVNETTGNVVCGHQRREALDAVDLSAVEWGKPYRAKLGDEAKRFWSTEREGWLRVPGGARYHVRRVKWPATFEKAANVAANSHEAQGEFTDELHGLIRELSREEPELTESLRLAALQARLAQSESAGEDEPTEEAEQTISPELFERHDYLVIVFDNEFDWKVACEKLGVRGVQSGKVGKRTLAQKGIGRVIPARRFLEVVGA